MARKKGGGHGGGHGWFVTFADLMALLMAFFVMLTAFSTQDQKKLQIVAGSMRDAFGTQKQSKFAGVVELEGVPTRPHMRNVEQLSPDRASDTTAPKTFGKPSSRPGPTGQDQAFALAAASLRQSLGALPELADRTAVVITERDEKGLEIAISDTDGRSMFAAGSTEPNARALGLLNALAGPLARLPNGIRIVGHATSEAGFHGQLDGWRLSTGRALSVREHLAAKGIPSARFDTVAGKADTEPMFPEDPTIAANRRVTITLLPAAPPVPYKPGARD